jgi:hypothetical protein
MDSLIVDLKEEHFEEWKELFDATIEEYIPIHNHIRKKFGCLVGGDTGSTYFGTAGDILNIFNFFNNKCVEVIKNKYPEIYGE